ncbi:MAG: ankyrin repeat domain-containing protein [Candidatus Endonucleobacter sp. (ex Gigantidas childressi)]|nr:ankyrin repeat domain-containing protein [Candidatus Endonucleobacter sp. (ex Gigantidas childressi)]
MNKKIAIAILLFSMTIVGKMANAWGHILGPQLHDACKSGDLAKVTQIVNYVGPEGSAEFFAGISSNGDSSMFVACKYGNHEVVKVLMEAVCSSHLSEDEKIKLLAGNDGHGCSALAQACMNDESKTVEVFLDTAHSSSLNSHTIYELLAGKNGNGQPLLYIACGDGKLNVVTALLKAICSNNFNDSEKETLLAGENKFNVTTLYKACREGHHKIVTRLIEAMCNTELNLDMDTLEKLIRGQSPDKQPPLSKALSQDKQEMVEAYLNAVLSSRLDSTAKVRLLEARTTDTTMTALDLADQSEVNYAVKAFVFIVQNSQALVLDEKKVILRRSIGIANDFGHGI